MDQFASKDIPRFSIDKLISIFQLSEGDAHMPGCLIAERKSDAGPKKMPIDSPFSLNAFVMFMCEEGEVTLSTNLKSFVAEKNHIFINFPGQIMHVKALDHYKLHIIVLDMEFIRKMNLDIKPIAQKIVDLKNNQCLEVPSNGLKEMIDITKSIKDEVLNNEQDEVKDDILRCLFAALFFKISRAADNNLSLHTEESPVNKEFFDKSAGYFKKFMILLGESYKQERSVSFYAEKLHLSPKYFTTLIKKTSGQTAAEWINQYVILEAKNLLTYSTMNVQEIAYHLNFPNQSFFGKYFKHHTGMTPSEYKKSK